MAMANQADERQRIDWFGKRGVELGKVLAKRIIPELENGDEPQLRDDSSANTLIRRYREYKGKQNS